jgi:probable DNA metabolism protein
VRLRVHDLDAFRRVARALLHLGTSPGRLELIPAEEGQSTLFGDDPVPDAPDAPPLRVPRRFGELAEAVALHRDRERWTLLYRVLWRLTREEPHLLSLSADPEVRRLELMARAVHSDEHRFHAFVRFRAIQLQGEERYVAWHRPDHFVVRIGAEFFRRRFGQLPWSILTPDESAHCDGGELTFGPGVPRSDAPSEDQLEGLWRTYYASTFNPARLNLRAMGRDLPARYRSTMPELSLLPQLVADAPRRTRQMTRRVDPESELRPFLPADRSLASLGAALRDCTACPLHERATRRCSEKVPSMPAPRWWVNSPETAKTGRAGPLSAPPASCSTAPSPRPGWTAPGSTSPMR